MGLAQIEGMKPSSCATKGVQDGLKNLKVNGGKPISICIITPYNRQVETLRLKLQENLCGDAVNSTDVNGAVPVNTVDSFQGQE